MVVKPSIEYSNQSV